MKVDTEHDTCETCGKTQILNAITRCVKCGQRLCHGCGVLVTTFYSMVCPRCHRASFPSGKAPCCPRVGGAFFPSLVSGGQSRPAFDVLGVAVTLVVCVALGGLVLLGAWM